MSEPQAELNAPARPAEMVELLTGLRDLHQPDPIGWWPPAPGWWLLLAATLSLLGYLLWRRYRRHTTRRLGRQAVVNAYHAWRDHRTDSLYLNDINAALRRIALTARPRSDVSSLTGQQWISTLNELSTYRLSDQSATALSVTAYQREPKGSVQTLHQELLRWASRLHRDHRA